MITLVGAGFLGSLWAEEFAKRLFATDTPLGFNIIDFDDVERRNVANQNFTPRDIGKPKCVAVAERVEAYGLYVRPIYEKLTDANKDGMLEETTFLVSATDNMECRNLLWYHGTAKHIPILHLGVSQKGTGAVEWTLWDDYDSWTLSPAALKGKHAPPPAVEKLRPCELIAFRGLGLNCAVAGAKAAGIWYGVDPEKSAGPKLDADQRIATTWSVFNDGHSLQDKYSLVMEMAE